MRPWWSCSRRIRQSFVEVFVMSRQKPFVSWIRRRFGSLALIGLAAIVTIGIASGIALNRKTALAQPSVRAGNVGATQSVQFEPPVNSTPITHEDDARNAARGIITHSNAPIGLTLPEAKSRFPVCQFTSEADQTRGASFA